MISIKRGLDLPISGTPQQTIEDARPVRQVALLGPDYVGMKPTMQVREGEAVRLGQPLFDDKKTEGVLFTAPAAGTVSAIHRGAKRSLQAVVIDVDDGAGAERFETLGPEAVAAADPAAIEATLLASGLWTALRTRPFSRIPAPGSRPHSLFVTAIDTHPLAADPQVVIEPHAEAFGHGLDLLARLVDAPVHLCTAPDARIPDGNDARIRRETFAGPHPAGLPGTHIHFLDPVGPSKTVWTIGYQDVIAIGRTFLDGVLFTERVVALGGPPVARPRLLRTRLGASVDELLAGETDGGELRPISGSIFAGRTARGALAFLGRYHGQVSVLAEDRERELFHYLRPGKDRFSVLPVFVSKLFGGKRFDFTTTANGSPRAMVPVGSYERVMPLDILPTQLLRALLVGDIDNAIALGALELDEEDLALCTFACPGKYEYGPVLRKLLTTIEKEG
ncbi:MAG: Na(+)-translocating NADH-quinone reductase subunit A [Pseudomonadales bacterium]|jgi:Na+-transporting NADH:ubiquinone oxidoreductase subunit A|nr:Na(+)-translocating NADH-quinone reductase subunit A [Pseudomonadales bacterium]